MKYYIIAGEVSGDLHAAHLMRALYAQDTAWLNECDLVIAECTCPSLGVGYELAYAERLGKPCFVFYDKGRGNLSAMIKGNG